MIYPRPVIRYPGGKVQLRNKIVPLMPANIVRYVEPFVGGGSMALAVSGRARFLDCYDLDARVINVHNHVKTNPVQLIDYIQEYLDACDFFKVDLLEWSRRLYDATLGSGADGVRDAAKFICNVQVSYGGRVDNSFGWRNRITADWPGLIADRIHRASFHFRNTSFAVQHWEQTLAGCSACDVVYLDPPYVGSVATVYDDYAEMDHVKLAKVLSEADYHWLLSYNDVPEVRYLYQDFHILELQCTYSFNRKKRGKGHELLISNRPIRRQKELI